MNDCCYFKLTQVGQAIKIAENQSQATLYFVCGVLVFRR